MKLAYLNGFSYVVVFFRYTITNCLWQLWRLISISCISISLKLIIRTLFILSIYNLKLFYITQRFWPIQLLFSLLFWILSISLPIISHVVAKVDVAAWSQGVVLFGWNGFPHLFVKGHEAPWWEWMRLFVCRQYKLQRAILHHRPFLLCYLILITRSASLTHFHMFLLIGRYLLAGAEARAHAVAEIS